jgi:cytochrome c oxidase cbb3-type subunit 4
MFRNILQSIQDIQVWPVIGLIIFFIFFIGMLISTFKTDRKLIEKMENLPLDEKDKTGNNIKKTLPDA